MDDTPLKLQAKNDMLTAQLVRAAFDRDDYKAQVEDYRVELARLRAELAALREAAREYFDAEDYLVKTDMHDNYTDRVRAMHRQAKVTADLRALLAATPGRQQ